MDEVFGTYTVEVVSDHAPVYPAVFRRSCCRRPGIAPSSTPTTGSSATTVG
jgi:hypothetical protein